MGQKVLDAFGWVGDDTILVLYAREMTTRDIQAQPQELDGVEVSPTLISNVAGVVIERVRKDKCGH